MNEQSLKQNLNQLQINILYQKILQASVISLMQICENSAEDNPFLEFEKIYQENVPSDGQFFENISTKETLSDKLGIQLAYLNLDPTLAEAANFIIELLDRDGYLRFSDEEICNMIQCEMSVVKQALSAVQSLEPPGIGARNFQECFILQMKAGKLEETLAFKVLAECGQELLSGKFSYIKKKMKLTDAELSSVIAEISKLDPFPARSLVRTEEIVPRFPDVIIRSLEPSVSIYMGEEKLFRVFINGKYVKLLKSKAVGAGDRNFLREKLNQARKFIMYLENRKKFMEKVIKYIIEYQKDFISGKGSLKPLSEKDLAMKFSCSCSLISRAVSEKYIAFTTGIFPVRNLFSYSTGKLSQDFIIDRIENIIKNADTVLSDRKISEKLKEQGISIAPRTVNKYRRKREILNSYVRRSLSAMGNK